MPNYVWDIIPEDTQHRKMHFAPYPEELCVIPIKSTCPQNGVVLDPFSGTGTTMKVAYELGRKSIGIDLSNEYIKLAKQRICQESGNFYLFNRTGRRKLEKPPTQAAMPLFMQTLFQSTQESG